MTPRFEDASMQPHRNGTVKEQVGYAMLFITLVSLIFTAGYQWRRVDELTVDAFDAKAQFMRKDVADSQFNTLSLQIVQLQRAVEQLGRDARAAR